ncbi:MAG: hypothetical protein JWO18_1554 [Microbacteriaceae bacterium]|nr:hypothetical protein [Microbacteriaceae bacterium]
MQRRGRFRIRWDGGAEGAPTTARILRDNEALSEIIARLAPALPTSTKVQLVDSLAGKFPVRPLLRDAFATA